MLDVLRQMTTVPDEILALHERPRVREATRTLDEARAKYEEAKAHLGKIEHVLAPGTQSATSPREQADEIVIIRARTALPQAQLAYWEAEAVLKEAQREFQRAVEAETRVLTNERVDARRSLIKELFALLDVAVAMAEQIQSYDDETRRLGGVAPLPPVPELLSDPYRQNFVESTRSVLKKEGWL